MIPFVLVNRLLGIGGECGLKVTEYDVSGHGKLVNAVHWQQADCHSFTTHTL